jgi:hypothetical protein
LVDVPSTDTTFETAIEEMGSARKANGHRDGRIGDFFGAVVWDIADGNPALAGSSDIDSIVPDARSHYDLAMIEPLDARGGQSEVVVDHDRIGIFDAADQLGLLHGIQGVEIGDIFENIAFEVQGLEDQIGDDHLPTVLCHIDFPSDS